jgi:hypothetical protein
MNTVKHFKKNATMNLNNALPAYPNTDAKDELKIPSETGSFFLSESWFMTCHEEGKWQAKIAEEKGGLETQNPR